MQKRSVCCRGCVQWQAGVFRDVAHVADGAEEPAQYVFMDWGPLQIERDKNRRVRPV